MTKSKYKTSACHDAASPPSEYQRKSFPTSCQSNVPLSISCYNVVIYRPFREVDGYTAFSDLHVLFNSTKPVFLYNTIINIFIVYCFVCTCFFLSKQPPPPKKQSVVFFHWSKPMPIKSKLHQQQLNTEVGLVKSIREFWNIVAC